MKKTKAHYKVMSCASERYRSSFGLHSWSTQWRKNLAAMSPQERDREQYLANAMSEFSKKTFTPVKFLLDFRFVPFTLSDFIKELGRRLTAPVGRNVSTDMRRLEKMNAQLADSYITPAERRQVKNKRNALIANYGSVARLQSCNNWMAFERFVMSDDFLTFEAEYFLSHSVRMRPKRS